MKSKVAMLISVATLALSAMAPNAMASGKAQPSARSPISVSKSSKAASSITVGRTAVSKSATAISKSSHAAAPSHAVLTGAKSE